jgi:hypothetical protein
MSIAMLQIAVTHVKMAHRRLPVSNELKQQHPLIIGIFK